MPGAGIEAVSSNIDDVTMHEFYLWYTHPHIVSLSSSVPSLTDLLKDFPERGPRWYHQHYVFVSEAEQLVRMPEQLCP